MAITQIFDPNRNGTGWKYGDALENGLNQLTHHKLQKLTRDREYQNNYDALIAGGVDPDQARGYAKASPEIIKNIFNDIFSRYSTKGITKPQEEQANEPTLSNLLQGNSQQQNLPNDFMQQLMQGQNNGPMTQLDALSQALQRNSVDREQAGPLNGNAGLLDYLKSMQSQQNSPQQQVNRPQQIPQQAQQPAAQSLPNGIPPTRQEAKAREIQDLQERRHQEKLALQREQLKTKKELEEEKRQDRKQMHWDKETLPVYKETSDLAKAANDSDIRLGRMEELNESGELNAPGFESALRIAEEGLPFGLSIDLTALRTADTEEFNKLSTDFLKDAKKFFGPKITDNEVKLFLKTVPSVVNTPEGRRRVIQNLRLFNEAARTRSDVMNSIIEENNGERPRNLGSLIEKRAKPQLDAIAERFKLGSRTMKKESKGILDRHIDNPLDIYNAVTSVPEIVGKVAGNIGGKISGLLDLK